MRIFGIEVQKCEEGFFWQQGHDSEGYFNTAEECAESIRHAMRRPDDDRVAQALGWPERY